MSWVKRLTLPLCVLGIFLFQTKKSAGQRGPAVDVVRGLIGGNDDTEVEIGLGQGGEAGIPGGGYWRRRRGDGRGGGRSKGRVSGVRGYGGFGVGSGSEKGEEDDRVDVREGKWEGRKAPGFREDGGGGGIRRGIGVGGGGGERDKQSPGYRVKRSGGEEVDEERRGGADSGWVREPTGIKRNADAGEEGEGGGASSGRGREPTGYRVKRCCGAGGRWKGRRAAHPDRVERFGFGGAEGEGEGEGRGAPRVGRSEGGYEGGIGSG